MLSQTRAGVSGLGMMLGSVGLIFPVPSYLTQVSSSEDAQSFLELRDSVVASGGTPHRVTEVFAGQHQASLRCDMEKFAAGQRMSRRLLVQLASYQLVKIDDTWAEASHRDLSRACKHVTGGQVPWVAATVRTVQSLDSYDSASPAGQLAFERMMRRHQAIGQSASRACFAIRLRPRKLARRALLSFVYRIGEASLKNWTRELGTCTQALAATAPRSLKERLQRDYLLSVLREGQLLSLPSVSDEVWDKVRRASLVDAQHHLALIEPAQHTFFSVVDLQVVRKKRLRSDTVKKQSTMGLAASIQKLHWRVVAGQQVVYHVGYPEVVDLVTMAPWPVWRCGLRQWVSTICAHTSSCSLTDSTVLIPRERTWRDVDWPVLALLDKLVSAGWRQGEDVKDHTLASPKVFKAKDPLQSKAYLCCLLGLPELLGSGAMTTLAVGQPCLYYKLLQASEQPELVLLGLRSDAYRKMLAVAVASGPAARRQPELVDVDDQCEDLEIAQPDKHLAAALQPHSEASSEEDGPVVPRSWSVPEASWPAKKRARVRAGQKAKADWDQLLWHSVLAPIVDTQVPLAALVQASDTVAEGRPGSSGDAPPLAASAPPPIADAAAGQQRWPASLEGTAVLFDSNGEAGQPKSYRRIQVVCQHHATCKRTRKFGTKQGQRSGLGDLEPYAFLGSWLRQGAWLTDVLDHKQFDPDTATVQAYAAEHGW